METCRKEPVNKTGKSSLRAVTEIPPGIPEEKVTNEHAGLETQYVIKGKLIVGQGEDEYTVEEGDTFSWHASVPHWDTEIARMV